MWNQSQRTMGYTRAGKYSPASMKTTRFHHGKNGFSVIELMVVLATTAILISVAIPGFQNVVRSSLLGAGADKFSASLSLARSKAIMARRNA